MNRRAFVVGCGVALLAIAGFLRYQSSGSDLKKLSVDEVQALLAKNDGRTIAYDCNAKEHYATEHLPGAKWVQYDGVTANDLPADKGVMLVFYCASEL